MVEVCTVPLHTVNLFVLQKQLLLTNVPSPSALQIADHLVGLHAKRPQTPYLTVFARSSSSSFQKVNQLIYEERKLLRAHSMRGTVHLLPTSRYRTILLATSGQLDKKYRRVLEGLKNKQKVEKAVVEFIRDEGPSSIVQIATALALNVEKDILYQLINELCTRGILVKATVNGSWRSSIYNYELLNRWQPAVPEGEKDLLQAQARLIEWYLTAYGPATLADISWWTGLSQAQVKRVLVRLELQWAQVHMTELRQIVYMLVDDLNQIMVWKPPANPQVTFLPSFDPYIMAYTNRERFVSIEHYSRVFRGISGIVEPVVLLDGQVVGTWSYALNNEFLVYDLFDKLDQPQIQGEIERAAIETAAFLETADSQSG